MCVCSVYSDMARGTCNHVIIRTRLLTEHFVRELKILMTISFSLLVKRYGSGGEEGKILTLLYSARQFTSND